MESEISGWLAECDPLNEGTQKRKIDVLPTPIVAKRKRRRGQEQDEEPIKEMANIKQLFRGKVSTSEINSVRKKCILLLFHLASYKLVTF